MLLVNAEARPSPIHGLGLFAVEPITKGTVVTQWRAGVDYMMEERDWLLLPVELREFLAEFTWRTWKGDYYGSTDAGRFTNHSATPNLTFETMTRASYAARDISAGEELTEDYSEFDAAFDTYKDTLR